MQNIVDNLIAQSMDNDPTDYIDKETGLIYCGVCHKPKQQVLDKTYRCFERYNNIAPLNCGCKKAKQRIEAERQAKEKRIFEAAKLRSKCFRGIERNFTFSLDDNANSEPSKQLKKWAANFNTSCKD